MSNLLIVYSKGDLVCCLFFLRETYFFGVRKNAPGKKPPGKMPSRKLPPGKLPPGNKPPKKFTPGKMPPRKIISLGFCCF